jgi:hypothetical protein
MVIKSFGLYVSKMLSTPPFIKAAGARVAVKVGKSGAAGALDRGIVIALGQAHRRTGGGYAPVVTATEKGLRLIPGCRR